MGCMTSTDSKGKKQEDKPVKEKHEEAGGETKVKVAEGIEIKANLHIGASAEEHHHEAAKTKDEHKTEVKEIVKVHEEVHHEGPNKEVHVKEVVKVHEEVHHEEPKHEEHHHDEHHEEHHEEHKVVEVKEVVKVEKIEKVEKVERVEKVEKVEHKHEDVHDAKGVTKGFNLLWMDEKAGQEHYKGLREHFERNFSSFKYTEDSTDVYTVVPDLQKPSVVVLSADIFNSSNSFVSSQDSVVLIVVFCDGAVNNSQLQGEKLSGVANNSEELKKVLNEVCTRYKKNNP